MKYLKKINEFFDLADDFDLDKDDVINALDEVFDNYTLLDVELVKKDDKRFSVEIFDKAIEQRPNNDMKDEFRLFKEKELTQFKELLKSRGLKIKDMENDESRNRIIINIEKQ